MTKTTGQPASRPTQNRPDTFDGTYASTPTWAVELAARRLQAIETFTRNLRVEEQAEEAPGRSREMRMDSARRLEVLRRQHQALVDRAHEHLQASGDVMPQRGPRRVVLAHRNEWFLERVSTGLRDRGLNVVAQLANGADAVGLSVVEQPDLVLVDETLAMMPGEQVLWQLRELCPRTRLVAQCGYGDRVEALLEAGAEAVRYRPPMSRRRCPRCRPERHRHRDPQPRAAPNSRRWCYMAGFVPPRAETCTSPARVPARARAWPEPASGRTRPRSDPCRPRHRDLQPGQVTSGGVLRSPTRRVKCAGNG